MEISVIKIGNSRGIRLPKSILQQLEIEEKMELEVHNDEIVLKPIKKTPREGWEEQFALMSQRGDDKLLIDELDDRDDFLWEW